MSNFFGTAPAECVTYLNSVLSCSRGVPRTSLPSGGEAPVALVSVTQTLVDVLRDTGHQLDGAGMKTTFTFPSN